MLQGYFDDSGNVRQGKTCLIAGYVAPTNAWTDFSDRWAAILKEPPAIDHFKMSNAFALTKQFKGWSESERDAKVTRLIDVINASKITYGVAMGINNADFLRDAKGALPDGAFINDVFYYLFTNVMETCLIHQRNTGTHEKVEFIFDDTDKPAGEVDRIFRMMMANAPTTIQALDLVDNKPTFRNDKRFLPLQAADLLAGQVRSWQERGVETNAMRQLAEGGIKVAYNIHDGRSFQTVVKGAQITASYVRAGPPDEAQARFAQVKAFLENLAEADVTKWGSHL
jgi:hypothetical protein